MEIKEYSAMYETEDTLFWYKGMRAITKELFRQTLPRISKNNILDAGCGTGANIKFLEQYGKVEGFDIEKKAVDYCKKRGIKNVKVGSITDIKSKNSQFDIVTCFDVMGQMEVKSERKAIQEFNRVLKPKGIILIRIAAYDWLKGYHDKSVHTKHRFTVAETNRLLQTNGFKILKSTYANTLLFPLVLFRRFILNRLTPHNKKLSSDVQQVNPLLNMIFYTFFLIEAVILKYISLPYGLSVIVIAQKK